MAPSWAMAVLNAIGHRQALALSLITRAMRGMQLWRENVAARGRDQGAMATSYGAGPQHRRAGMVIDDRVNVVAADPALGGAKLFESPLGIHRSRWGSASAGAM